MIFIESFHLILFILGREETRNEPSTSSEKIADRLSPKKSQEKRELDQNEAVLDLMADVEQLEEDATPRNEPETKFIVTLDGVEDHLLRSLEQAVHEERRDKDGEVSLTKGYLMMPLFFNIFVFLILILTTNRSPPLGTECFKSHTRE